MRRDQLQSEPVSGIEARAGETQVAGRSRVKATRITHAYACAWLRVASPARR